jgi:RNA polymerase sigma factor (sigma-70 family)
MAVQSPMENPVTESLDCRLKKLWQGRLDGDLSWEEFTKALVDLIHDPLIIYIHSQFGIMRVCTLDEDEVFDEAVVRFMRQPPRDPQTPVLAWFRKTIKNCMVDELRRVQREVSLPDDAEMCKVTPHPADEWLWQVKRVVDEALDTLPEDWGYIPAMYYSDGLTQQEIATEVGLSRSRIDQYLDRAVQHLKSCKQLKELMRKKGEAKGGGADAE